MQITRTPAWAPPRVVIYGEDKIGKSTFAAEADAVFVRTEDGQPPGAQCLPVSTTLDHFVEAFVAALDSDADVICVDHLTGLEQIIRQGVCKSHGVDSIEKVGGGYGKGFRAATEVWEKDVVPMFDEARARGKALICIAHHVVKRADAPDVDPFDAFTLDLHKGVQELIRRWADVIAFAQKEKRIEKHDAGFGKEIIRAVDVRSRVLRLTGAAAYVAGNRYGLPDTIKLSWPAFNDALATAMASR